jgi:uncharacterized membrane protein
LAFGDWKRKTARGQGLSELTKPATILCNYLMPDEPPPPPPISNAPKSTGLPSNIAAAIATFPLVGGLIFYLLEKQDSFVRFYSMQSIIFGAAWFVFWIASGILDRILASIPVIAGVLTFFWGFVQGIINVAFLVIWIIAMVKAFTGARWEIPYIGPIAKKQVGES